MVTNVTMKSKGSRGLYGVVIRQETKNSFLSLTDLQEAYTRARVENGWHDKRIRDILTYEENTERIYYLLKEQGLLNDKGDFFELVEKNGIVKTLKELKLYKCYGKGRTKVVFCQKYIWLLICQEISSKFYADVIQYLFTDKSSFFDFVPFDAFEYEETQQSRINHENAWKYFYPEGRGKPKEGYCLHHIDPDWRYSDKKRYNEWNPKDLQMLTNSEHWKIHQKIGFGKSKDIQLIEACELNKELRSAMAQNLPSPDYPGVNKALNVKVFGYHENGMRNKGSESQLHNLNTLEETMAYCIKKGFYKTNAELLAAIKSA